MKITSLVLVCASALLIAKAHAADETREKQGVMNYLKEKLGSKTDLQEDEAYWNRFMQGDMSLPPTLSALLLLRSPGVACEVDAEVTCTDAAGTDCNELDPADACEVEVTYTYTAENIGTNDMTITTAQSTFNDEDPVPVPIVGQTLTPGDTATFMEGKTIDLCSSDTYLTTFEVEAESENGFPCNDADVFELNTEAVTPPPTPSSGIPPPTTPAPTPTSGIPPPTTPAPTEECDIKIQVDCIPLEDNATNTTSCEALPPLTTLCEDRPTWMQFKYYGGDCSQSANSQATGLFLCTDFATLPPGEPVFIRVFATTAPDVIYFEGPVEFNGLFNVTDPNGDRLESNMNITTYASDGGELLQSVQYHSSCSQNLFLKDRFGDSQLVAFFNEEQGLVDCFVTANYTFTIVNEGEMPGVLVSLVALTTPFGPFDLTEQVAEQDLGPGDTFVVTLPVVLDLTVRQRYTVLATITGQLDEAAEPCSSSDFLEFVAGNALPPSIPTVAPTTLPV